MRGKKRWTRRKNMVVEKRLSTEEEKMERKEEKVVDG